MYVYVYVYIYICVYIFMTIIDYICKNDCKYIMMIYAYAMSFYISTAIIPSLGQRCSEELKACPATGDPYS